jgi:hypothetical protein
MKGRGERQRAKKNNTYRKKVTVESGRVTRRVWREGGRGLCATDTELAPSLAATRGGCWLRLGENKGDRWEHRVGRAHLSLTFSLGVQYKKKVAKGGCYGVVMRGKDSAGSRTWVD